MAERSADEFFIFLVQIAEKSNFKIVFSAVRILSKACFVSFYTLFCIFFAIELHFEMNDFQVLQRCKLNWPKSCHEHFRLARNHSIKFYEMNCCFQIGVKLKRSIF